MIKKTVIRVGDTVRVVRPRWIKRVGYALHFRDLVDEVENDPRTQRAWKAVIGMEGATSTIKPSLDFLHAVAKQRVAERGFGGPWRTIHYESAADYDDKPGVLRPVTTTRLYSRPGQLLTVYEKRLAKTGRRFPPTGDGGDYWPGGLDDIKTHVILSVGVGEIEDIDVELVRRAK